MKRKFFIHSLRYLFIPLLLVLTLTTVLFAAGPVKRDQIPEQYRWNLADIYPDEAAWQNDFSRIQGELIPKLKQYNGKLTSAKRILDCMKAYESLFRLMDKVYVYAHMKADENQADNDAAELSSKSETLNATALTAAAFIQPEILTQSESKIQGYIKNPLLKDYRHFLEVLLKQKPHTLSKAEEELLASASDMAGTPRDIRDKAALADLKFPVIKDAQGQEVQLSSGVYAQALESQDRNYRKRAFEGMFGAFDSIKNTLAAALSAEVKKNIFFSRARKYDSSLEAALAAESVPRDVYDNLVKSVNDNVSYLHKYVRMRKQILGLDKVHFYDMYVPLVENYEMKIPYEDAKGQVLKGLQVLGPEYLKSFEAGYSNRWIDVYETENKATGGYQWGSYDTHPYILLNYMDTLDDMLTLAHEMGHAMNFYYSNVAQNYINANTPIFTAEVASTTNELLMDQYLIANAGNDQEKLYLLNNLVENIRGSVYTQVMYAEFEKTVSERVERGEAISAKSLNEIWAGLMKKYYGEDFLVDDLAPLWWARIPHFYMNFYVYKYATSMAAANQVVKNLTVGTNSAAYQQKYLQFLKAGSSDYPIEVLKAIDVDMTSTEPVANLLKDFGSLVDQMEAILQKQGKLN